VEHLFQFLFKYRPLVFARGTLAFDSPLPAPALLAAGLVLAALAVEQNRRLRRLAPGERWLLGGIRVGLFAILALCLARPILVVPTVVPQQNFLAVVLDDSRSMRIADWDGQARGAFATTQFGADGALGRTLTERFKVRTFRFAETARRLGDVGELGFDGRRSDLAQAILTVHRELGAVPLAGVVVVSDGAANGPTSLNEALLELDAAGVPVHTIGVGKRGFDRDIAIGRVVTPRRVLRGSAVAVDVALGHHGFGGENVTLSVEDGGRILATRQVALPRGDDATTVRVHFTADDAGARRLTFRVTPGQGEQVAENNVARALLEVDDARRSVLYFEGEPRWEVAFLRRAVAGDENVRVAVLQRTAPDKFLRLDVDHPEELASGFPTTRAELFRYDALILGSVEASFFTHDQLRMIVDFVGRRGGGLLVLGGRHALAEGGYAETPIAEALPVVLDAAARSESAGFLGEVAVRPTPLGRTHAVTQLFADPDSSDARWRSLPPLTAVNRVTELKPGASALLIGDVGGLGDPLIVLAYQRYGRGKALAFPVQDSWLWQMHADIPLDDLTHETLWRQILRWLVSDVARPVTVGASEDLVETGTPVNLIADVSDSAYLAMNGAHATATITAPDGTTRDIPMEWTVQRDGEYHARFSPDQPGLYQIHVGATQSGAALGEAATYVEAGDLDSEFRDAEMNQSLLERVSEETGGKFYTPETVATLPEDVTVTRSGAVVRERRDLWDMPIVFFGLVALAGAEWGLRRRRGLA
jgi:uncharacterized membrane protein